MNNLRISKKNLILIVFLVLLVVILLILKIFQKKSLPVQTPTKEVTPSVIITSSPPSLCSLDENIKSKLPFITVNYTIQYLPVPKKFFVTILKNPYEEYKTEVEKWLTSYGIDPNGPCVFWASAKGVAPKTQ